MGYVELIYAVQNNITYCVVRNRSRCICEGLAGFDDAAAAAASANMPTDFRVSITNANGKDAYPICSFTWLLIPQQSKDAAKGKVLRDFVSWMLRDGEREVTALTYAPLPQEVAKKLQGTISTIH